MTRAADSRLDAALSYARLGWAVFPITPGTKFPFSKTHICTVAHHQHGHLDATTDQMQIDEWWTEHPDANIGIATGKISGLTVLDVDMNPAKGKQGMLTLLQLIGGYGDAWPDTSQQRTWSGGRQYFFAYDPRVPNRAKAGDLLDIDTRNDGGYVVAPPSVVSEGGPQGTYTWVVEGPLARMPESVIQRLTQGSKGGNGNTKRTDAEWAAVAKGVGKGARQSELPSVCGKLIAAHGPGSAFAREQAHAWAERCDQSDGPLTPEAVDTCFDNIEAKEITKLERRAAVAPADVIEPGNVADGLRTRRLSSVTAKNVEWLWPDFIPKWMLTVLGGDPDQGKSMITHDLIGRVTTGREWPDGAAGGDPASVLLLASEDALEETIKPRMLAAGVDEERVRQVTSAVVVGKEQTVSIGRDIALLDREWQQEPFSLLVVDPLNAYLQGLDTNQDNHVRGVIGPLADWASRRMVAVLAIVHNGKNGVDRTALQRLLGSTAFGAAARACYLACPDADVLGQRLLLCTKLNLGPRPLGLAYRIEGAVVPDSEGRDIKTARVEWVAGLRITRTADEALKQLSKGSGSHAMTEAKVFLAGLLAAGPVAAKEAEEQAVAQDIALRTLDRARAELKVQSNLIGFGAAGRWYWLPTNWTKEQINGWKLTKLAETVNARSAT